MLNKAFRSKIYTQLHSTRSVMNTDISIFNNLRWAKPDEMLSLNEEYDRDHFYKKVDLHGGLYYNEEGNIFKFDCIRQAEKKHLESDYNYDYPPVEGLESFISQALRLPFGSGTLIEGKLVGVQSLAGTGSLKLGLEFLRRNTRFSKVYIPEPSWPMHRSVIESCGLECLNYRYYNKISKKFDLEAMLEDLDKIKERAVVVLHACAHNPTGCDPSESDWRKIHEVVVKRGHFPLFDMAYQGLASGNLLKDSQGLRTFSSRGCPLAVAYSFAKNFCLYGERVGFFSLLCSSHKDAQIVKSNLCHNLRTCYLYPPSYGARLINIILSDHTLTKLWETELRDTIHCRLVTNRLLLHRMLTEYSEINWNHILYQKGMFVFTGLSKSQCRELKTKYHIYLTEDGRMNLSAINKSNLEYVTENIIKLYTKQRQTIYF